MGFPPTTARVGISLLATFALVTSVLVAACASAEAEPLSPVPPTSLSDAPLAFTARFPTNEQPGTRFPGCVFASPQGIEDGGRRAILVASGSDLTALDPRTGATLWSVVLPASDGEEALVVATPVVVGRRVVVAYHTIKAGAPKHVTTPRLHHRAAVVDLDSHAIDPAYPVVTISPTVKGRFGDVVFVPGHALARSALVHATPAGSREGRVYVTYGNARDLQPYHGYIVELDLDAWRARGAGAALTAARTVTEDLECGVENGDGSSDTKCGGGIWSAAGPLVVQDGDRYSIVIPTGNGQLDLHRGDYANTLMRVGPGLAFDPGCDPEACRTFSAENLASSCVDTCTDLFVPRLLPGEALPRPEPNVCDGRGLYACWAILDQLDGGSTPVDVVLPSGKRVFVYPTKDGHLWLVDGQRMGQVHAHHKLTEYCGAPGDQCAFGWAGTIVTKPVVTTIGGAPAILVPTFMGDTTHPAGVVALRIVEDGSTPRFEPAWQFPPFSDRSAQERFRRHPSRLTLATPRGMAEHAFVIDVAAPGRRGRLAAIRSSDGKLAAEVELAGPGIRFSAPLFEDEAIFVGSCDTDRGEGTIEAYDVASEQQPKRAPP